MKLEKRGETGGTPERRQEEAAPENTPKSRAKRENSVILYTSILFVVALALILLSYFMQKRTNDTLSSITEQHGEITAQALQNIEELQRRNEDLNDRLLERESELGELDDLIEELTEELEELEADLAALETANVELTAQSESLQLQLAEQQKRTEAIGLLAALLASEEGSDVSGLLSQLESMSAYLDGAYLSLYESHLANMNSGEENNDRH